MAGREAKPFKWANLAATALTYSGSAKLKEAARRGEKWCRTPKRASGLG